MDADPEPRGAALTAAARVLPPVQDPRQLRTVFGAFATGVTVVTVGGLVPHGMTANSFTSVSLDPPLVLVCVSRSATMHEALMAADSFAVSVLAAHQESVARHFADRHRPRGLSQFAPVDWSPGSRTGAPLINGALAWLECGLRDAYSGGDHSIFLGDLMSLDRRENGGPLLFFDSTFRQLTKGVL
jgi:flavin reductase (DIM6/NTAB) family NADH-FMN oxidoreductase RutF